MVPVLKAGPAIVIQDTFCQIQHRFSHGLLAVLSMCTLNKNRVFVHSHGSVNGQRIMLKCNRIVKKERWPRNSQRWEGQKSKTCKRIKIRQGRRAVLTWVRLSNGGETSESWKASRRKQSLLCFWLITLVSLRFAVVVMSAIVAGEGEYPCIELPILGKRLVLSAC